MANNINQVVDSLISINQVIENFRLYNVKRLNYTTRIVLIRFSLCERMKWDYQKFLHFY